MDWIATVTFSFPEGLQVFWGATIKKLSLALMGHGPFMHIGPEKFRVHIEVKAATKEDALNTAWTLALGAAENCKLTFLSPLSVDAASRGALDAGMAEESAIEANVFAIQSQAN